MSRSIPFENVARMASPGDNVAIAIRRLEAGTELVIDGRTVTLPHTTPLGHRFAVKRIAPDEELKSWERPFGVATGAIAPGDYICNQEMLDVLSYREAGARLPARPNFASRILRHVFDPEAFAPAPPVGRVARPATFLGYRRGGGRGVGTRNYIVILGASSRTAGFARALADRLQPLARAHPSLDGIVAVGHTEGGDPAEPNNMPELLRALAGYIVHPNVAAILCVDYGVEPLNNARLRDYLDRHRYPLAETPHRFLSITGSTTQALAEGEAQIRAWLPRASEAKRTAEPLAGLCCALQCGGSDAFSGISGNPLVGAVGHEVIRHGGRMCLTETDELIGAESYILQNMRDLETAKRFLEAVERFKTRLAWHGSTAEGNPSGGNKMRGLYNITLKSIGAAAKKSPITRVDRVIDYAERLLESGFYFMDGPGNDLEGIAGQAAGGCNLFLFVTGNGSITNFPFVPTIKITTTTARHELLRNEMDVNAGRYLDGESMDALRDETFELARAVASGQRTQGERAGHSQISIWRNWRQTDASRLDSIRSRAAPDGQPLRLNLPDAWEGPPPCGPLRPRTTRRSSLHASPIALTTHRTATGRALERIGLVLPASLCSSQIARMAAQRLNDRRVGAGRIDRYVALAHTEGCGFSGDALYRALLRTYRGYLTHPNVAAALVLEHGCEKIPNDLVRQHLVHSEIDPRRFGWASVQLDGGIDRVLARIEEWFAGAAENAEPSKPETAGLEALAPGLVSVAPAEPGLAAALIDLTVAVVEAGGSVFVPVSDPLVSSDAFATLLAEGETIRATLANGERAARNGLHLVETESAHPAEIFASLGACGANMLLCAVDRHPCPGHPMLPVLQVAPGTPRERLTNDDIDCFAPPDRREALAAILSLVAATASGAHVPRSRAAGLIDFQLTRGLLGVST